MTAHIKMYATRTCPYCVRSEQLLKSKGFDDIEKILVDVNPDRLPEMLEKSGGRRMVPQIFFNDQHIGGFDDLVALDRAGKLQTLLSAQSEE